MKASKNLKEALEKAMKKSGIKSHKELSEIFEWKSNNASPKTATADVMKAIENANLSKKDLESLGQAYSAVAKADLQNMAAANRAAQFADAASKMR